MDTKTRRKHLNAYTMATRNIELSEVAIAVLDRVNTNSSRRAIAILSRGQQQQLKLLDASAEMLGAPYGA